MKIKDIIRVSKANIIQNGIDENQDVQISTDTRTIKEGDFYLPLKGATFDGENFIEQALEKGAAGAFCTHKPKFETNGKWILCVDNTLDVYLKLANYRRNQLNCKVIGVTGSSGKTTTKELVASVVSEKFNTFKTPLNHNNEIGLCQTIFEAPDDTEVLVLEMGMRGLGEIEILSKCAEPDISIIANVGTAHIGRLGSRENIAKAKCEITKYQKGNIFIAHNDELIKNTVEFEGEKIFYSIKDVKILEKSTHYSRFEYKNNIYELNAGGEYNIENALAAINAGLKLNMNVTEIQKGLAEYKSIEKRWESVNAGGYKIINDSYNANPESMRAFVDTIFELYDDYVLILGDMGELGKEEVRYHSELGQYINSKANLTKNAAVISIGHLSQNITDNINKCKAIHFDNIDEAVNFIKTNIPVSKQLFLKASRSMKFEKIIEKLSQKV